MDRGAHLPQDTFLHLISSLATKDNFGICQFQRQFPTIGYETQEVVKANHADSGPTLYLAIFALL